MFRVIFERYTVTVASKFPALYDEYHKRATLVETFFDRDTEKPLCIVTLAKGKDWPFLVIAQQYEDYHDQFHPAILLVPETSLLFIGAGERLLAYSWDPSRKLWEETIMLGFWGWERYRQFVIMAAELEFSVWDIYGRKLWSMSVEPPWDYKLVDEVVHLNVMGEETVFYLENGVKYV